MTSMASKLTKEHLEQIAEYLADKFPAIKQRRASAANSREIEIEIRERIVRVEEELKNQRDIIRELIISMDKRFHEIRLAMNVRFEQVDKHFEQIYKRFESTDKQVDNLRTDMDKRFTMMMWFTGLGLTIVTTFLTGALVLLR